MKARIKSKSSEMKLPRPESRLKLPPTRVFPFSFVSCLFALFIIENCFSRWFLRCHRSVIVTGFKLFTFSFIPRLVFVLSSIPSTTQLAPIPVPNGIHVSFHPANIHTNIFQSPTTRYTKVIPPVLLLVLAGATRGI